MSADVVCPTCHATLRPTPAMLAKGGNHPCPICSTLLVIGSKLSRAAAPAPVVPTGPTERSAKPSRRHARRAERASEPEPQLEAPPLYHDHGTPGWVWPSVMVVLVFILCAALFSVFLLLRQGNGPSGNSVIRAQYDKVKLRMTADQVIAIMGNPNDDTDPIPTPPFGERILTWTDRRTYTITVTLNGGSVTAKKWEESGSKK